MAGINLFTHYNPNEYFKFWLERELELANNDPVIFMRNMMTFYISLKTNENLTPFLKILKNFLAEWFKKQLIHSMSLDYSVQVL